MARVELPVSRLRARKRRRRLIVSGMALGAVLLLVGGFVALVHAPFLEITSVQVEGTKSVASSSVQEVVQSVLAQSYIYVLPHDNIFIYPNKQLVAALVRKFPEFKSVEVHAQDFHTIVVRVVEREPLALWCAGGDECNFMDEDGVVYATAPQGSDAVFVTYQGTTTGVGLPKQFLTLEQFRSLAALVTALGATDATNTVRQVVVDASGDVRAYFQNDFLLIFVLGEAGGDVFERFTLARKADPFKGRTLGDFEYLDLRWGDKLYYKQKAQ